MKRGLLAPESLVTGGALAIAVALAWGWLLSASSSDGDMAAMAMPVEPWSAGYLLPTFLMWAVMMVAMMVPSASPMILLHARIDKAGSPRRRALHTTIFAGTYLGIWTLFAAAAAAAQALLLAAGMVSAADLTVGDRIVAAALLAAAAAYQLTVAKRVCLDKCRSPLLFILRYWRPGLAGALRLGIAHGLFCVGCCWALMLLLFVGGVMNLAWVAALGVLVVAEKVAPARWHANRWLAAMLLGAALLLLAA